jgi:hypothetical protein
MDKVTVAWNFAVALYYKARGLLGSFQFLKMMYVTDISGGLFHRLTYTMQVVYLVKAFM